MRVWNADPKNHRDPRVSAISLQPEANDSYPGLILDQVEVENVVANTPGVTKKKKDKRNNGVSPLLRAISTRLLTRLNRRKC